MGCDGGTIPKRGELVRTKKNPEKKDKESDLSFKWGHCSITQEPLQRPIVACQLGRLCNKTSVIESILNQKKLPDLLQHIKSLKDVKELNLTDNPEYKRAMESKDSTRILKMSPYICPLIGLEMNGKYRFVYFWSCGCVLSERALKIIKDNNCHKCLKPFKEEDIVVLNGTEEDKVILEKKMLERQTRLKAEKKLKKENKCSGNATATATGATTVSAAATATANATATTSTATLNSEASCSSVTNNVDDNSKTNKTTLKSNSVQNGSKLKMSLKRPNNNCIEDPVFKKTCKNYSVAKDPKATEVFKSLFTTHSSAEKQEKAHWITYNPFYN